MSAQNHIIKPGLPLVTDFYKGTGGTPTASKSPAKPSKCLTTIKLLTIAKRLAISSNNSKSIYSYIV